MLLKSWLRALFSAAWSVGLFDIGVAPSRDPAMGIEGVHASIMNHSFPAV
jgi:hypothetical protein